MFEVLCSIDPAKYCPQGSMSPPAIQDVCANWGSPLFSHPNSMGLAFTSLWTLCGADLTRICETDSDLKNWICPTGRVISANICGALPAEACTAGSSTFKPCAFDIYECMAKDRNYDFCHDFPSLCHDVIPPPYNSYQDLQ